MPFVYIVVALIFVIGIAQLANRYIPMPPIMRALVNVVLGLIVVGMVLWLINTYIPMAGAIRALLNIVVFLATCVAILQAFGLWDSALRTWHTIRHKAATPSDHVPGERLPH